MVPAGRLTTLSYADEPNCFWHPYTDEMVSFRVKRSGRKGNWYPPDYIDRGASRYAWRLDMRRKVLDAAATLLDEVGPRQFTVKAVAKRAGIGRTSIYKHIGLKAELLAAVREDARRPLTFKQYSQTAAPAIPRTPPQLDCAAAAPPALEPVQDLLLTLADSLHGAGDLWLLATAEGLRCYRQPRTDPPPGAPASPFPGLLLNAIESTLTTACQSGALPRGTDVRELALSLCGLWWLELTLHGPAREAPPGCSPSPCLTQGIAWLLKGAAA